jgi:hypothetical protein
MSFPCQSNLTNALILKFGGREDVFAGVETFPQRTYGVSLLADRERQPGSADLEAWSRDALLVGKPESNIPPRDRRRLSLVSEAQCQRRTQSIL